MTDIKGKGLMKKLNGKNEVVEAKKKPTTLKEWFAEPEFRSKIMSALPKVINPEAFLTNAYNIYVSNKKLQECTVFSFLESLMDAAKVGLMPNSPLGTCFIIPYRVKGVMVAKFQMGYPGHTTLAYNTKMYENIYGHAIYERDEWDYCYGYNKHLNHIPNIAGHGDRKPIFWYGVYRLLNGGGDFVIWSYDRMMEHRDQHSKSYNSAKKGGYSAEATWETDLEFMGVKTMVIQVLKLGPKSTEMVHALSTEPGAEGLRNRFKDTGLEAMSDMSVSNEGVVEAEIEEEPGVKKEDPVVINKQTGEVVNDITAKEKEEIERAVNKAEEAEEATLFKEKGSNISKGEDFVGR